MISENEKKMEDTTSEDFQPEKQHQVEVLTTKKNTNNSNLHPDLSEEPEKKDERSDKDTK